MIDGTEDLANYQEEVVVLKDGQYPKGKDRAREDTMKLMAINIIA